MAKDTNRGGPAHVRQAHVTDPPRRGEVWSVFLPGQPDDPHQPRPALVISANVRNRATDDLIVLPIFSTGAVGPTRVPLLRGVGGIKRDSLIFCEEITTIDRDFVDRGPWGPPVDAGTLRSVVRAIRLAVGEVVPPELA